jgi:hypothetical protein
MVCGYNKVIKHEFSIQYETMRQNASTNGVKSPKRQKASINGKKSPKGKRPQKYNKIKYNIAIQPVRALKIKKNITVCLFSLVTIFFFSHFVIFLIFFLDFGFFFYGQR